MDRRKKQKFVFDHVEKVVRWRTKAGRFTRKRKGARRFEYEVLWVRSKDGKLKRYGSIRPKGKRPLVKLDTVDEAKVAQGIYIKGVLEDRGAIKELTRNAARGVEVTVTGRARGKDRRVRTRVIFDRKRLKETDYLSGMIAGRIQKQLAAFGLRLSHHSIARRKNLKQLTRVNFTIHIFY